MLNIYKLYSLRIGFFRIASSTITRTPFQLNNLLHTSKRSLCHDRDIPQRRVDDAIIQMRRKISPSYLAWMSALHIAVFQRKPKSILHFCRNSAVNINQRDKRSGTAIQYAVRDGYKEGIALLLQHGASTHVYNSLTYGKVIKRKTMTTEELFAYHQLENARICNLMSFSDGTILISHNNVHTLLHETIKSDDKTTLLQLLEHGIDVNASNHNDGETPLITAVRRNWINIVEILLRYQADVNKKYSYPFQFQQTALHVAVEKDHLVALEMLLKHGANINEQNSYGNTPVMYAISQNKKEALIKMLSSKYVGKSELEKAYFMKNDNNDSIENMMNKCKNEEIRAVLMHYFGSFITSKRFNFR